MLPDLLISLVYLTISGAAGLALMSWLVTHDFFLPEFGQLLSSDRFKTVFSVSLTVASVVCAGLLLFLVVRQKLGDPAGDPTGDPTGSAAEPYSLTRMVKSMDGVMIGVIGVLLIMSVYSVAVVIERYLTYSAAKTASREFAARASAAITTGHIEEAINISDQHRKSHIAMVVGSGLQEFRTQEQSSDISGDEIEASKRALQRAIAIKTSEFKRGLSGLATIGSIAPFVGLFGTVFGIINAFRGMKNAETAGIGAVTGGISEALLTTALGLLVAVPAVWLFNYFTDKVDEFIVEMDNAASELVDTFIKNRERKVSS